MLEVNLANETAEPKRILLTGVEGTGKTRFLAGLPRPLCVFSFDRGIATLAGQQGITAYVFMDDDRYHPKAWQEFLFMYSKLKSGQLKYKHPDGREEAFKSVAIDSVTALSKFILDHANYVNNTIDAKVVGFEPYTRTKSFLQDIVVKSVLAQEYICCTALLELEVDKNTGQLLWRPSTEGKFREEIGQWFDVVGFMQVDIDLVNKKPRYTMDVLGDKSKKAKIRLPIGIDNNVPVIVDPTFQKLVDLYKTKNLPTKGSA